MPGGAPCSGSYTGQGITDVAVGQDGSVWYTNQITKAVGHLVPGGTQTEYTLNSHVPGLGAGAPQAITAASDGSLWLAVFGSYGAPAANAIVHIVPGAATADPTATVYKLGAANAPLEVAPDNQGSVWFTGTGGAGGGPIGRIGGVPVTAPPIDSGTDADHARDRPDDHRAGGRDAQAVDGGHAATSPTPVSGATRSTPTRSASARRRTAAASST